MSSKGAKPLKKADVDAKLQAIMARRESRRTASVTEDTGSSALAAATTSSSSTGATLAAPDESRGFLSNLKRMMSINRKSEDSVRKDEGTAFTASLMSCPLKPEVYQKAFESGECFTYAPSSRLYTSLFAVLQDTFALELFAHFLSKQKMVDLLRFWAKAEDFHSESGKKSPQERLDWALQVYRTFICRNAPQCLNFDDDVVRDVELNLSPESGDVSSACLDKAMAAALDRLETFYFPLFLKSPEYAHLCESVLKSEEACIEDVLYNETALMIFMEYMDRESAAVILHFWLAADNFAQQAESGLPAAELQADAIAIFNRFFAPQAREPLGVDEATRAAIESRVTQAGGVSPNAFDRARHLTITALRHHFFPGFCRSDLFAKLLTDLRRVALPPTEPSRPPSPGEQAAAPASASTGPSGPIQARLTVWGEYIADPQSAKGPPLDHGALATQLNNIVKLTVGKLRGVRKADLDLAQRVSQGHIGDLYGEMAAHHTLAVSNAAPCALAPNPSAPPTASPYAPPPARARPLPDESLDPVSSTFSSLEDWAIPAFD